MWDEGIEMARTAHALDEALASGDLGRIAEIADLLSGQVKREVGSRAEAEGWYEEYDRATSHERWMIETVVDPYGPAAFPARAVPASQEDRRGLLETVYGSGIYNELEDRALKRLRRQAGFRTAADFAAAAGIPTKEYHRYERGSIDAIPPEAAEAIAKQIAASGVPLPGWLTAAATNASKSNPYLRSYKQTLEERGWRVLEGVSGDVFNLTHGPMFPGVDPEFTVPLDMRGKDLSDPRAWIEAARNAAASDIVFWTGGARKDEPGWIAEKIKRFKEGALAELPQLVEDAMTAAPWLDFTEADVKVPEAAWAFETEDGHQCVAECHLTDDEDSPWGCAFYFSTYTYSSELRMWQEYDGGMFWGYKNADDPDLKTEALCACKYPYSDGDERRIDYGLLDIHGVWDEHGLPFTPEDLRPAILARTDSAGHTPDPRSIARKAIGSASASVPPRDEAPDGGRAANLRGVAHG